MRGLHGGVNGSFSAQPTTMSCRPAKFIDERRVRPEAAARASSFIAEYTGTLPHSGDFVAVVPHNRDSDRETASRG
jgi:hypothetical protein